MLELLPAQCEGVYGPRILLLDDDPAILRLLKGKLEHAGYEVFVASSGKDALGLIDRAGLPDLAIVDIRMPGMDGVQFCRTVQGYADLPVIVLSALAEEEAMVDAIHHFAEDYILKPFSPRELVARVGRVLRRRWQPGGRDSVVRVDDHLTVDFAHQRATLGERSVSLTPSESKLLHLLVRHAGEAVSNAFLLQRLWPAGEGSEDALRVTVHRLRDKIGCNPVDRPYIRTLRGVGYSFVGTRE